MKLTMPLGKRSYDIIVKRGALARVGQLGNLHRKVLIVSDKGVPEKYVKTVSRQCAQGEVFLLEQGETSKSPQMWQAVLSRMLELRFGRQDAVLALGGGVVGDLSGFVAACYMRGIAYFQVPTTTLSQIDSSIGGKTAINMAETKNMVGAFHQPELVIIDPDTLATLPPRHFANGLAEALKTALIGCSELLTILETEPAEAAIERILYLSLRYKMGVVHRDETEQGERRMLNFGHTIGHGIESAGLAAAARGEIAPEKALLHGEAVALGMLPMIETRTLARRARAVMKKLGLPTQCPYPKEEIYHFLQNDKKRRGDEYTVVKVKKAGQGYLEKISGEELQLLVMEGLG